MRPFALGTLILAAACRTAPPQAPAVPADPASFANAADVRVQHLALDLEVDFETKRIDGMATLTLERRTPLNHIVLDTRDLTIRSIRADGLNAPFFLGRPDPILGAPLTIELRPDTKSISIAYTTSPQATALQWLDPPQTAGKRRPFLLSQSQSINARSWVPIQDTPGVRFTYEAVVRVPRDLLAVMSAENPKAKTSDGVYRFRMPQPVPAYLLALSVGDLAFRAYDSRSGVYAEGPVLDRAAAEFDDLPRMIDVAEELFGPYRWGRYDLLVLPPSFPYGGMENPRLTFLTPTLIAGDKSLVSTVAHELAHSWSGNLVTNATWNDFWLNEGFTTYAERRIVERLYGREYAEMQWVLGMKDLADEFEQLPPQDEGLVIDLMGRNPDEAPSVVPYEKGALFLRLIEEHVGREKFDAFLRSYFSDFAFQTMTTARFLTILRERLIDPAALTAEAWMHAPGLPANAPQPKSEAFARVEWQVGTFMNGGMPETRGWSTHEWLHFIHHLPEGVTAEDLRRLDERLRFSESGNSEILAAWLDRAIEANYSAAFPALERFLLSQGRRKYLRPLYLKLAATPEGRALALRIYERARPAYHPISQSTIDEILKDGDSR
jgi:aminopeptidase N